MLLKLIVCLFIESAVDLADRSLRTQPELLQAMKCPDHQSVQTNNTLIPVLIQRLVPFNGVPANVMG